MGKHTYVDIGTEPMYKDEEVTAILRKLICPSKACGGVMVSMGISLMSDKTLLHRCPKCKSEVYTAERYPMLVWKE